jgi:Flp pilus assembly pilin Flp
MRNAIARFVRGEEGMEMVEWAIVGVVFAVAAATFWGNLADAVETALDTIADKIDG